MSAMILACTSCDSRYDVTGYAEGQQFRCRCSTVLTLTAPSSVAGQLACPHCGAGVSTTASTCAFCSADLLLKACPRCTSRVFTGYAHCPCCGVELHTAAVGDAHADRPCPRCDKIMHGRLVGDVLIDECTGCQGVFLDHVAIKRVVLDRQQARAESLLGALPRVEIKTIAPATKMYVKCPCCHVVMNRKQFATGSGVIIDVCKTHGVFFDAGELPATVEFVMSGGVERAHELDLKRQRETMRSELMNVRLEASRAAINTHDYGHSDGHVLGGILASLFS